MKLYARIEGKGALFALKVIHYKLGEWNLGKISMVIGRVSDLSVFQEEPDDIQNIH